MAVINRMKSPRDAGDTFFLSVHCSSRAAYIGPVLPILISVVAMYAHNKHPLKHLLRATLIISALTPATHAARPICRSAPAAGADMDLVGSLCRRPSRRVRRDIDFLRSARTFDLRRQGQYARISRRLSAWLRFAGRVEMGRRAPRP